MAVAPLCQHLKPTIVDCLRNFEEGRNLDFVSTQLGHAILSVQQADALDCHGEPDGIIQNLYPLLCEAQSSLENVLHREIPDSRNVITKSFSGDAGRPHFDIAEETLQFYVGHNFSAGKIAEILGASKSTVFRRMRVYNLFKAK